MRIKLLNWVLIINICTVLLILAIVLTPSNIARIILGLPFVLFFPGYTLLAALFTNKDGMGFIERVALSLGISIAIVALIGFGLNYTAWGITLEPILYSIAAFVFITSAVSLARRAKMTEISRLTMNYKLKLPGWGGSKLNKLLSITLIVFILGALTVLGYTAVSPGNGEKYTELYILGLNKTAQNYPTGFIMNGGRVTQVGYSAERFNVNSEWGKITLGIVNHEYDEVAYLLTMTIDGEPTGIIYNSGSVNQLGPINLAHGEKWEQEIGFAPQHTGENQKVEILLYKNGEISPDNSLNLWINARETGAERGS